MSRRFVTIYWILVAAAAFNIAIGIGLQSPPNLFVSLACLGMAAVVHVVGRNT